MIKHRIISIMVLITILLTGTLAYGADSSDDYATGEQYGTSRGLIEGESVGKLDAQNKSNTKYEELSKRKKAWEKDFILLNRSDRYIRGFMDGFTEAFEAGYRRGYDAVREDEANSIYGANDFGIIMGRIDGYKAYRSGSRNSWERYIPSDREIRDLFELNKETLEYRNKFIEFFKEAYQSSFEAAFQVAKLGEKDYSYEQGLKAGDEYARSLAELNGKKDYLQGLSNNYQRNMPSHKEIIVMFHLSNEHSEYRDAFLTGFEYGQSTSGGISDGGYIAYYNNAYREANKLTVETPDGQGYENGGEIGRMKGEYEAIMDVTMGKLNSWSSHKKSDTIISNEYGLGFQSENYRASFILGYWDEFMKSYNETYKRLQQDTNKVKTHTEKISMDGKKNIGIFGDDKFLVDIEAGTYYNDVIVTVDNVPASYLNLNSWRYTQASGVYGLKIINPSDSFDRNKKITVKFKSYGNSEQYGIYKYHYNKWIYIPSVQEGNYLVADININNISSTGNIYAVRVDHQLPTFHDIRGHWAKNEINTYIKREVIYGYPDGTFKPDRHISRGEFVTMLSRLYDWYPPQDSSNVTKFRDYAEFGYAEKAISYATYHNIVQGYADETFKPQNPITYREVEIIMSRIIGSNFNWHYIAEKMMYEKKIYSESRNNMNHWITRAEFTFLLHELNEWQY
ncbi:S-layer homology domain-containing protein [Alkaliphilus oremlandii]|uniref:S-layer domain protein n=1 Tax=Alkaliphilus oremlandii (strain OhILAs) TaxID=350688 RepID=A8MGF0_ALKOO|nr:S-layer homology domain-containing protein [Alkaliphilus oremlandii]ABW19173.1 S-layer domain protein [Alkaliphilus oremlandii OhILAs]